MAPFSFGGVTGVLVTLAIGFAFGFVLERAGFGNARNLAAQFYLTDMRVLKVMFTAIVTAMLLLFASSALGLVDFQRIWVPPTYLGSAVVGGLLLGIGFIIGGYCPGTSLVSMSTLKVDGAFFAGGVFFGLFVFAQIVPSFWNFWNNAGAAGRLTLADWLGVDPGLVVLGVAVMAIGAFWAAELAERHFSPEPVPVPSSRTRMWRRAGVAAALLLATVTALVGSPSIDKQIAWHQDEFNRRIDDREVFIDPAELLDMMHNNQIQLVLLDVRSEGDFNLFHLVDARRVDAGAIDDSLTSTISPEAVVVAMSNDEQAATEAWKRLAVHANVNAYVLAGGVNRWLDVYRDRLANVPGPDVGASGPDVLRHHFGAALGDRLAEARPKEENVPERPFDVRVHLRKPVHAAGGGCG